MGNACCSQQPVGSEVDGIVGVKLLSADSDLNLREDDLDNLANSPKTSSKTRLAREADEKKKNDEEDERKPPEIGQQSTGEAKEVGLEGQSEERTGADELQGDHGGTVVHSKLTDSMPKYRLLWLRGVTGMGEAIRQVFVLAGIRFEDDIMTSEEWGQRKQESKFASDPILRNAQLPMLEITHSGGSVQYMTQARAILRYLGSIGSYEGKQLYPEDSVMRYHCDENLELIENLRSLMMPAGQIQDEAERHAARTALVKPGGKLYQQFQRIEARLGRFTFVAGDALSISDCFTVVNLYMFQEPSYFAGFPRDTYKNFPYIDALRVRLCSLPPLQSYYKGRDDPFRAAFIVDPPVSFEPPLLTKSLVPPVTGSTPRYKLMWFPRAGIGEAIRQAFTIAGIVFEDEKLTSKQWTERKSKSEYAGLGDAQLPILEITYGDGSVQHMTHSRAILRYVGSIGSYNGRKLYPDDSMSRYHCDEMIELIEDIRFLDTTASISNPGEKKAARSAMVQPGGKMYPHFLKIDASLRKSAFAAGNVPSVADCYAVAVLLMFQQPTHLDGFPTDTYKDFPNIRAVKDRLCTLPPLQTYYRAATGYRAPFSVLKYKLFWYEQITGMGEAIRQVFVLAGIQFEDELFLNFEHWRERRQEPTFASNPILKDAQLPMLEITHRDGSVQYMTQSRAILRYVGSIGFYQGKLLYPEDKVMRYHCDEMLELAESVRNAHFSIMTALKDDAEKVACRLSAVKPGGKMYQLFQRIEARLGRNTFVAGDLPSIGDCFAIVNLYMFQAPSFFDGFPSDTFKDFPNIQALKDRVCSLPALQLYYKDTEDHLRVKFRVEASESSVPLQLAQSLAPPVTDSHPTYKLMWFARAGMGESIRQVFTLGGIDFEDEKLTAKQWSERKRLPQYAALGDAQLPILEITYSDGSIQHLTHSRAILRYVGSIASYSGELLYPETSMARYHCDEMIEVLEDVRLLETTLTGQDQGDKKAARAAMVKPAGKMYPHFQKIDLTLGKSAFVTGDVPSVADCYAVAILLMFQKPTHLDGFPSDTYKEFPNIGALKDRLCALPPLEAYYKDASGDREPFKVASPTGTDIYTES